MRKKFSAVLVLVAMSTIALAQAADPDLVPQIDETSPFAGVQEFFAFGLPTAIDSVGVGIGVTPPDKLQDDRASLLLEKEIEELDLMDKLDKGQIDTGTFQNIDNSITSEQVDTISALSDSAGQTAESEDDNMVQDLSSVDAEITATEQSGGADVSEAQASMSEASTIEPSTGESSNGGGEIGSGGEASANAGEGVAFAAPLPSAKHITIKQKIAVLKPKIVQKAAALRQSISGKLRNVKISAPSLPARVRPIRR